MTKMNTKIAVIIPYNKMLEYADDRGLSIGNIEREHIADLININLGKDKFKYIINQDAVELKSTYPLLRIGLINSHAYNNHHGIKEDDNKTFEVNIISDNASEIVNYCKLKFPSRINSVVLNKYSHPYTETVYVRL